MQIKFPPCAANRLHIFHPTFCLSKMSMTNTAISLSSEFQMAPLRMHRLPPFHHMNDGLLRMLIKQDDKCVFLEVRFLSWFWLKWGFPVLTSLKPVHRCGNEVVRLKVAGLSEALVFCHCQFVINTKWHDQRQAFLKQKSYYWKSL